MTPAPVDRHRARSNPWKLTAYQCMTLRLVCQYGGSKRVNYAVEEANPRTIEHHLLMARRAMGMLGTDVRLFLKWDRWVRKENDENG